MRVVYISHTSKATDGSSKALIYLAQAMRDKGIDILVILPRQGELYQELQTRGIRCIILRWNFRMSVYPWSQTKLDKFLLFPRLIGRLIINSFATLQVINLLKKNRPDLIHTNSSVTSIGYYVAKFLKIPHIWHIREYGALNFQTFYYYPTFKHQKLRYNKQNSYTICITKDLQRYNALLSHINSIVIYDGVLPANAIDYVSHKKPYFLCVGRLEHIKGILPLIDAYANYYQTHSSPLPLYIAGNGNPKYTELVIAKIQDYGIENQVKLLGMIDDVMPYYKEAKALIVPSLFEGFGFITAEAMFSGCLVIGNNVAGTKEQFDNGLELTGEEIALRYTTEAQLVQHLIDVTNNPIEQYEPIILRGQEVVRQLYTAEKHVEQVYDLYKKITTKEQYIDL